MEETASSATRCRIVTMQSHYRYAYQDNDHVK
jgi:hypothetical protein